MEFLTQLLPFQEPAVEKLRKVKVGALYMPMGSGKTRVMLELIKLRMDKGKVNAVLWLCPCSVQENLADDIIFHTGQTPKELNIVIKGIESLPGSHTLYPTLLDFVSQYNVYLVIDESNLVKNPFATRTQRITEISKHCSYKAILNGTPVSKNEADLFAQWYCLDWRILGFESYYSFAANHLEFRTRVDRRGVEHQTKEIWRVLDVGQLTSKIEPFSFQITKRECMKLPPKRYTTRFFYMTDEQEEEYSHTLDKFLSNVDETDSTTIYKLFTALQHVSSGRRVTTEATARMETENIFEDFHDNPRIECFRDLAQEMEDDQVVVFAKYKEEIREISETLSELGLTWTEFTGSMNPKNRQRNLRAFRLGEAQFLLANKQCGAYGLNLQFAHRMIFYSNDFDFATRIQAEDRLHRIGQTKEIEIYDICADNSIDDMIAKNLDRKDAMLSAFQGKLKEWQERKELRVSNRLQDLKDELKKKKSKNIPQKSVISA